MRRRRVSLSIVVFLSLLAGACVDAASQDRPSRGYFPRPCGFDLDGDGIIGEPIDDCRVCDGITLDPDGDGVNEDWYYVDADSGSDTTGNGSSQNPYRTIQHAWGVAADGPADGAEDIVCFSGTAREESIMPAVSGVPGVDLKPSSGSEARSFELPSHPTMLIGWDQDGDGCYPPYDDGVTDIARCGTQADVAVLDGAGLDRAFLLSDHSTNNGVRYLEMAHFTARDYGFQTASDEDIGFLRFGRGAVSSHLYLHDLELENINRGKAMDGNAIVFDFFIGGMDLAYVAMVNIAATNVGSFFARGGLGEDSIKGPVRFQNIGYTGLGCSRDVCGSSGFAAAVNGFKLWGTVDGLEVIDSVFDANTPAWRPRPTGPIIAVIPDACSQDWTVRNNLFRNWATAFVVKGANGFCEVRPVDDVLIDSNYVVVDDAENHSTGAFGVSFSDDGTSTPNASVADTTVVNNFFYSEVGWRRVLFSNAGNEQGEGLGTVVFAGNSVHGYPTFGGWAFIHVEVGEGSSGNPLPFPLPRFRIENNVFTGLKPGEQAKDSLVINFLYRPSRELVIDHNTYDPVAAFRWLGTEYANFGQWRSATGYDGISRSCTPVLMDAAAGDLHLAASDTCARDMGGNISAYTDVDIDGDVRPLDGTMGAGADGAMAVFIFADGFESGDTSAW